MFWFSWVSMAALASLATLSLHTQTHAQRGIHATVSLTPRDTPKSCDLQPAQLRVHGLCLMRPFFLLVLVLHDVPVIGVEEVCEWGRVRVLEGQQRQGLLQLPQILPLAHTHGTGD